ncbi:hypothetical protein DFH28DRAFT_1117007 [Melampsora americana]|nr:hypothetical protein DFH28DRAFT_1117007 [Melampsora americana]
MQIISILLSILATSLVVSSLIIPDQSAVDPRQERSLSDHRMLDVIYPSDGQMESRRRVQPRSGPSSKLSARSVRLGPYRPASAPETQESSRDARM